MQYATVGRIIVYNLEFEQQNELISDLINNYLIEGVKNTTREHNNLIIIPTSVDQYLDITGFLTENNYTWTRRGGSTPPAEL